MTGVFLIIILAVVWYVAGIFHSFALMLYVAVNLLLIAGMYILTRIYKRNVATVYKGNIIKNLIMDCQSYTKYRPNETTGGIFVSWRRKEELPTGA